MPYPCDDCIYTAEHPIFRFPTHLVHPEHGKAMCFDVRGEAVCPDCGAVWRATVMNTVELQDI